MRFSLSRFRVCRDPCGISLHEILQELVRAIVDELAVGVEQLVGAADIGFGLRHGRDIKEDKRLPQMMVGAKSTDTARRGTDDRARLTVPCALAIGPPMAFFSAAGTERLCSGVTNRTASADLIRSRNAVHSAGGFSSPSWL